MATTAWLVLGLAVWMLVGVLFALLLGRMIRLRDNPPPSRHGYSKPLIPIPPDDPAVVSSNDELNETPDEPSVRVIQEGQVDLIRPRLSCGDALPIKIAQ